MQVLLCFKLSKRPPFLSVTPLINLGTLPFFSGFIESIFAGLLNYPVLNRSSIFWGDAALFVRRLFCSGSKIGVLYFFLSCRKVLSSVKISSKDSKQRVSIYLSRVNFEYFLKMFKISWYIVWWALDLFSRGNWGLFLNLSWLHHPITSEFLLIPSIDSFTWK